jgi:hypothetical protein
MIPATACACSWVNSVSDMLAVSVLSSLEQATNAKDSAKIEKTEILVFMV